MKRYIFTILACCCALFSSAQVQRPKLVVGLAIDQMRWDYLYYYYNDFSGGLKRLVDEGFSCENTLINYTPTVTAIGHSCMYTGSVPSLTGIAGNDFRMGDHMTYCCTDTTVQGVGSSSRAAQMSPRNMWATTIGDMLREATDCRSKVVGVALKDRASILPAGHAANAAYWWDSSVGHYVTSTYYMNELPRWVEDFNKTHNTKPGFDIKTNTKGVTMTFDMARAAIDGEQLGQRGECDMLCVSVSSTDAIGHTYGTRGTENKAVYMQLDKDLGEFLNYLDRKIGRGNYLLWLSADHGAVHNPNFHRQHHVPAEGWDAGATVRDLNQYLQQKFGIEKAVMGTYSTYIFLNHEAIEKAGKDLAEVRAEAVKHLQKDRQFVYAIDLEHVASSTVPQPIREQIINGYCRGRSGDIYVVLPANYLEYKFDDKYRGTTHSMWYPYDAHIPLVFLGWNIEHGETSVRCGMSDIAPTVCAMLHIQMPDACIGNAILPVVDQ